MCKINTNLSNALVPVHSTPASSLCVHTSSLRVRSHRSRANSSPEHFTFLHSTSPPARPKRALPGMSNTKPQSSSLQTTAASSRSQPRWHTVPHWCPWRTSTLPEHRSPAFFIHKSGDRVVCGNNGNEPVLLSLAESKTISTTRNDD